VIIILFAFIQRNKAVVTVGGLVFLLVLNGFFVLDEISKNP